MPGSASQRSHSIRFTKPLDLACTRGRHGAVSEEFSNMPVPWITKDGFLDAAKFPIDGILEQAMESDGTKFGSSVAMLRLMHGSGRKEAGVFLMGLLVASDENWERRLTIVEALRDVQTDACARLPFAELRRVTSSNSTRR